MQIN
jgi:hypothetical protein